MTVIFPVPMIKIIGIAETVIVTDRPMIHAIDLLEKEMTGERISNRVFQVNAMKLFDPKTGRDDFLIKIEIDIINEQLVLESDFLFLEKRKIQEIPRCDGVFDIRETIRRMFLIFSLCR
jgi:hypothetical protein